MGVEQTFFTCFIGSYGDMKYSYTIFSTILKMRESGLIVVAYYQILYLQYNFSREFCVLVFQVTE